MCNWAVTGLDGGECFTNFENTEEDAKALASSCVRGGHTNVQVWERRYSVEAKTTVSMVLPNNRREEIE